MNAIFTRTSIRQFEEREVEQEKIEKLLQAAFASPTAKNQQAWEFYVVTNKEILQKLSQVTPFATPAANAPAAIVVCSSVFSVFAEFSAFCAVFDFASAVSPSDTNIMKPPVDVPKILGPTRDFTGSLNSFFENVSHLSPEVYTPIEFFDV